MTGLQLDKHDGCQ